MIAKRQDKQDIEHFFKNLFSFKEKALMIATSKMNPFLMLQSLELSL